MTTRSGLHRTAALATLLPLLLGLGACGQDASGDDDPGAGATGEADTVEDGAATGSPVGDAAGATEDAAGTAGAGTDDDADPSPPLEVVASFYPVEYLASRLAGERATVTTLTSPGVDPHDVELSPRQVASLGGADLVLFTSGMQPAVDQAVSASGTERGVDLTEHADLLEIGETEEEHGSHGHDDDRGDDDHGDDDHGDEDHGHDDDHDHGPEDPHFWLDPERYAQVAEAIAAELVTIDPDHADAYEANLAVLTDELEQLDAEFEQGLADCRSRDLVTTHEAFAYLANRYDLHQIGITGISPESEPSPARLAEVTGLVRGLDVDTIFAEPILSDDIARTVAAETGAQVLTLDPVEGITEVSAGTSYLEIMRANLQALREGLDCR